LELVEHLLNDEFSYCSMLGVLDPFWPPVVQCFATEDAVRIVNFFITIPTTRTYNHSQLFLKLCPFYTAYKHTRSSLQSLITLLHVYTGRLLSYQLLAQIITHYNYLTTPPENCLVGLLLKNWQFRHSSSLIKPSILRPSLQQRARWELCCITRGNAKVSDTPLLLLPGDVTAACCVGTVFQYCCVTSSRLRGNLVYRSAT
jgi:hypothetical protein